MDAAQQTLTRSMASQGFTGGGLAAEALAKFGGQFQNTAYNQQVSQLAQLAGAGGVASPGAGQQQAYQNLGTNLAGLGSSLGSLFQNMGSSGSAQPTTGSLGAYYGA